MGADYGDGGLLMCEICNTPKEAIINGKKRRIMCQCEKEAEAQKKDAEDALRFKHRMKELQAKFGLSDGLYDGYTFEADDNRDTKLSNICHRYVERWEDMKDSGIGILFYGDVGTGKSFYACAIANALLALQVPALVTNFPRILNLLQIPGSRQEVIDTLRRYQLLVIDDLGSERDSAYAFEQVYAVIDARSRAGLPLIVTTNLSISELENPDDLRYARIYDRLLELCPLHLKLAGKSRRLEKAMERKRIARELLNT